MFQKGQFRKNMTNKWKFRLFLLLKLPLAFIVGLKLNTLSDTKTEVILPFKWLNTNPFKSMYFACLTMAAELSTGIVVMDLIDRETTLFSMLVLKVEGEFMKRGIHEIKFSCKDQEIAKTAFIEALKTNMSQTFVLKSIGYNNIGEPICQFAFTWSIKAK